MRTQRYEYKNEWDNESLVEHNLENNSTDKQKRFRGAVTYFSPSRKLILKEELAAEYNPHTLAQDTSDCMSCLKHLALSIGISEKRARANRNVAIHTYSANEHLTKKRTCESIGKDIAWRIVRRAVIHRYVLHYKEWAKIDGPAIIAPITPEKVLDFCQRHTSTQSELYILMGDLRLALFKLIDYLHSLSILQEHRKTSVYLAPFNFLPGSNIPFSFNALLNHVTKQPGGNHASVTQL